MKTAEKQLNDWIGTFECSEKVFFTSETKQLQAKKIAMNILKEYGQLLSEKDAQVVQRFLRDMRSKNTRLKLSKQKCYQVMNIGKSVNRQLFKKKRKLNQAFR